MFGLEWRAVFSGAHFIHPLSFLATVTMKSGLPLSLMHSLGQSFIRARACMDADVEYVDGISDANTSTALS